MTQDNRTSRRRQPGSRRRLLLAAVLLAISMVATVTTAAITTTTRASAASGPIFTVMNTSETLPDGVWFRNSPHTADTDRVTGHGVYMNEQVRLRCYAWGDAVGPYNNQLWYFVLNVTRPTNASAANQGYLNAHYINDGKLANQIDSGLPQCGAAPTPPPPPNAFYNRTAAINWALTHAQDPQAYGAMCTWFVSNALWAGGFPKTAVWTDQGSYGSAPGTRTAWWLPSFLSYIQANFSTTLTNITSDFSTNAVPQAQPGDLILYDWGNGQGISHVALVVDIAPNQYPEVSEMGQYDLNLWDAAINKLVHVRSSYVKRGWTWSAVNNRWLQWKYPNVKAYLLHINGGHFLPTY